MYRNAKNVGYFMIGPGALTQLSELLLPLRSEKPDAPAIFFIDHFFERSDLADRLPIQEWDMRLYIDTTNEPSCESVDMYADRVKRFLNDRKPAALLAFGGGSTMDTCKCVGNLLTNPGAAADYQGKDLVKNPAPYKIAIPTLSGSGSESSRTGIMINKQKKIKRGMNSDYSMFDQILLDPTLTKTAPRDQYFHTGMETFMHCFDNPVGSQGNSVVDAHSEKALELSEKIFLSYDMMSDENRELMMIASYNSGQAAAVAGLVRPIASALSVVLGVHNGVANCLALSALEDIYPDQWKKLAEMMKKQNIQLPAGICKDLSPEQYEELYQATIINEKPLKDKLGENYKDILTKDNLVERFKRM